MIVFGPRSAKCASAPIAVVLIAILATLAGGTTAHAQDDDPVVGLGGGSSFPEGAVFGVPQGAKLPPAQSLFVDNIGDAAADIEFVSQVDEQAITITPEFETFTLEPGALRANPFSVDVGSSVPPGDYNVFIQHKQVNVPVPTDAAIATSPGVGANFVVQVSGESAKVTLRAVSAEGGSPPAGRLWLAQPVESGRQVVVAEATGSTLETTVAPGHYFGNFEIEGLVAESVEFDIATGEDKIVEIEIEVLSFLVVGATPIEEDGKVVAVELVSSVLNRVRRIDGSTKFEARVTKDGDAFETFTMQEQPLLPTGSTDVRTTYRPEGGFDDGTYRFVFALATPEFTVTAEDAPVVEVNDGSGGNRWVWLVLAALVVVFVLVFRKGGATRGSAFAAKRGGSSNR